MDTSAKKLLPDSPARPSLRTMKTKPTGARRAQTKASQTNAPAQPAPCVWNTLGVATQFAITPARVTRCYAAGEIKSSVRTLGGDLRPRVAFTLHDMQGFADVLIVRESRDGGDRRIVSAAQKFLRGE